jgi:hypothetical protein
MAVVFAGLLSERKPCPPNKYRDNGQRNRHDPIYPTEVSKMDCINCISRRGQFAASRIMRGRKTQSWLKHGSTSYQGVGGL